MLGRGLRRFTWLVVAVFVAAACGSPTSPSGQSESVTWTVNGQSFTATSNGRAAGRPGGNLSVTGSDCGRGAFTSLTVRGINFSAPGTYPAGTGAGQATISWHADARTSTSDSWTAPGFPTGGSGSVTISSISNDWVSGSFTAELVASLGNTDKTSRSIQGNFELSFRERVLC